MVGTLRRIAQFFRDESCGQCVPCRVGTVRQEELLARLAAGRPRGDRATELAAPRRHRPGDARREHLRPRPDGELGDRERDPTAGAGGPVTDHQWPPPPDTAIPPILLDPPARPSRPPAPPPIEAPPPVELTIDGQAVSVPAGSTIFEACRAQGIDTPTLCYLENLTPVNVCRVCVVEVTGSRVLVPACSRKVEAGHGRPDRQRAGPAQPEDGPRVPRLVGRPLDGAERSTAYNERYAADSARYGPAAAPAEAGERDAHEAGHHHAPVRRRRPAGPDRRASR